MPKRNPTPWENQFWIPQSLFDPAKPVFILAGGPSLANVPLDQLRGQQTISINSSAYIAQEYGLDDGVLWFTDNVWWHNHKMLIMGWKGPVMTVSRAAKREAPALIRRLEVASPAPEFPMQGAPVIRWGRSSGHTAISLAVAMGAKEIVLLGYDMRLVAGASHHHNDYDRPAHFGVYEEFIEHFAGWHDQAKDCGVDIWNATLGSALKEFPSINLETVMKHKRHINPVPEDFESAVKEPPEEIAEGFIGGFPIGEIHSKTMTNVLPVSTPPRRLSRMILRKGH